MKTDGKLSVMTSNVFTMAGTMTGRSDYYHKHGLYFNELLTLDCALGCSFTGKMIETDSTLCNLELLLIEMNQVYHVIKLVVAMTCMHYVNLVHAKVQSFHRV